MLRILLLIVSFFVVEGLLLAAVARHFPVGIWVYLLVSTLLGWWLLTRSHRLVFAAIAARVQRGEPIISVISPLRYPIAGLFFLLPGILSDVIALVLLFLPTPRQPQQKNDSIEGEFHRLD